MDTVEEVTEAVQPKDQVRIGKGRGVWTVDYIENGMATVTRDPQQWERFRKCVAVERLTKVV